MLGSSFVLPVILSASPSLSAGARVGCSIITTYIRRILNVNDLGNPYLTYATQQPKRDRPNLPTASIGELERVMCDLLRHSVLLS